MNASRTLPHSLEAEKAVLGCLLIAPNKLAEVQNVIDPQDFYHPCHRLIYESALELDRKRQPIDSVLLADA